MHHLRARHGAFVIGSIVVASVLVAAPAHAAPWDGNDVVFGPGEWEVSHNNFKVDDVYLVFPDASTEYTDIWDTAGQTTIVSSALGVDEEVYCENSADVDVEVEAGTGDLVFTCVASNAAFVAGELEVVSEIRVLEGGETVRFLTTITNVGDVEAVIDGVEYYTNFGSSGFLWNYENQSDDILPVPAPEDSDYAPQLNLAEAQWIVHWERDDAPGGIIIGQAGAPVSSSWTRASGDTYEFEVGEFSIPMGESRSVVTFVNWDPQTLIEGGYENFGRDPDLLNASADNVVAMMADFAALDGVLANGIDDLTTVVNWVAEPVVEEEPEPEPELAETGPVDVVGLALAALVLLGVGAVVASRRRMTV
jgi:hypothetical protein